MSHPITLDEATELLNAPDGLMSAEDYWEYSNAAETYKAEHAAETAWLRAAENFGWEEVLMESYVESGLMARW